MISVSFFFIFARPARVFACAALVMFGVSAGLGPALAQTMQGVPNALQGFSQNRDQPVQIEAATLEVRDKDQTASFTGDVKVVQGDTTMLSKSLVVFYDREGGDKPGDKAGDKAATKGTTMKAAQPGPGGSQKIKRLEARGGVTVTQKDQTVTGAIGIFDMRANTVTLQGGVVLTQGQNVLRGERLVVDLTSGAARVESGKSTNGRVQGLFHAGGGSPLAPGAVPGALPGAAAGAASGANSGKPAATPQTPAASPGKPLKLNALPLIQSGALSVIGVSSIIL